jgi:hypothetical protein
MDKGGTWRMINVILNALTGKLKETFGVKVYINQVPQNFEEPCFFVHVISTDKTQIVDLRYKAVTVFGIDYIADENRKNSREIYEVIEKLNGVTNLITLENGDIMRGTKRKTEIQDGNMHSFIQFSYFINGKRENEKMEILSVEGGIKKDG